MPKAVDDNVKATIQSAVESIAREFSSDAGSAQERQKQRYVATGNSAKHVAVFSGVFAFVLLISIMWVVNLRQSYSLLHFTNSAEDAIFSSTRNDFSAVLDAFAKEEAATELRNQATVSAELGNALEKESLKAVLGAAIKSSSATSTTSTTIDTTTSTIE